MLILSISRRIVWCPATCFTGIVTFHMSTQVPQCALCAAELDDNVPVGVCSDACVKLLSAVVGRIWNAIDMQYTDWSDGGYSAYAI